MKYIIDVPEEKRVYLNVWKNKDGECVLDKTYDLYDLIPYTASESYIDGLKKGQNEVWDFVRKIDSMGYSEIKKAFTIENNFVWPFSLENYKEAKDIYEKCKVKNAEIRVGDEVEYECDGIVRFVVFGIVGNTAYGFKYPCDYDDVGDYCDIDMLKKTGRHFDELEKLLRKVKED